MNRILSATLFLSTVALSSTAFANGEAPQLTRVPHNLRIKSWRGNGPHAHVQGMHVAVTEGHPGTHIVVERQKRSEVAEVSGEMTEEKAIALSEKVSQWKEHMSFTTKNTSSVSPHQETHHDPAIVMRPNSRFRVVAKTRDGQNVESHGGLVEGNTQIRETRMNIAATGLDTLDLRGQHLRSARAWMVPENVYVSIPETNPKMVKDGEGMLKKAVEMGELIEKKNSDMKAAQTATPPVTGQPLKDMQTEIATITAEKTKLETDGRSLITEGKRSTVEIVSIGGLPVSTQIIGVNTRLREENQQTIHTFTANSDAKSGFLKQKLEALPHDDLSLDVNFGAVGDSLTSYHHVQFAAPAGGEKPAFEMGGKKYYRIVLDPTKTKQTNNDPAF